MKSAKIHFEQNIIRVKNLGAIYKSINSQTTQILDLSDILRAQYVMLVSALDHFIHEIVRIGMLETYLGKRKSTKAFKKFIFSIDDKVLFNKAIMVDIINEDNIEPYKDNTWLDYQIRHKNGFKSFQQADKIEEAILLVLDIDLWLEIENRLSIDKNKLKNRLNLIIKRRNQIAHEADIKFEDRELRDIRSDDIDSSIIFIELLVKTIFDISELKN
ncbi:hypothetical protein MNB_SV-12-1207 [hydrothermal vent metagenome]|uniref:RiboL-PSP-HEPN domain-containing protein n=1 Tax=hydrothermal vent metagenome TaxID=652676 RepID=A0A1W1CM48_9ZZZZ